MYQGLKINKTLMSNSSAMRRMAGGVSCVLLQVIPASRICYSLGESFHIQLAFLRYYSSHSARPIAVVRHGI